MIVARSLEGRAATSMESDTSPVTVADLAIQALIAGRLYEEFPNDALMADEHASLLRAQPDGVMSRQVVEIVRQFISDANSEQLVTWIERGGTGTSCRVWARDPIDGTKGFLGGRQYVLALALIVDGMVRLAVMGCPRLPLVGARACSPRTVCSTQRRSSRFNVCPDVPPQRSIVCEREPRSVNHPSR